MSIVFKISLFCSFILLFFFDGYSQSTTLVTIEMKDATLKDIVREIQQSTEYSFVFNEGLNMEQRKNICLKKTSISGTLKQVFDKTGIGWQIVDKHIILNRIEKITISGYVADQKSLETLIGSAIKDENSGLGSYNNSYGYYSIQVVPGVVKLQSSYIGYKSVSKIFFAQSDTIINFHLSESHNELPNVTVYDTKSFSPSSGSIELAGSELRPIPSGFSENDILKSLQTLPGVSSGAEGSTGVNVRGGSPDQNLILIDGIPIYNIGHIWGFFSVFNGDAIKNVSLYKGSFPARFGGRLSSVIDIRLRDGDMRQFHADFTVGLLTARLNLEGPIIKEKTSYSLSLRRSYIDGPLWIFHQIAAYRILPVIYIYDINAKINHKFSDKSRLYLSYYKGYDKLYNKEKVASYLDNELNSYKSIKENYSWGSDIISLRWNYIFNNKIFMNATAAYNKYQYTFESIKNEEFESKRYENTQIRKSKIKDIQFSTDFEYQPHNSHYMRFGGSFIFHDFSPEMHRFQTKEVYDNNQQWKLNYYLNDKRKGREASLYAEDEFAITKKLKSNLGTHFSLFNVQGQTYSALQPRISFGYELTPKTSLKASYTKMHQYVNLLSSNTISQPTDLWVPITKKLKPMSSDQFTGSLFFDTQTGYNFSVEGFYKYMNNVLEYKDDIAWKDAFTPWEDYVEAGNGRIRGIELFAKKTQARFTGWIGYTLSWSDRRFKTINQGRRFWSKYDSRHNINIAGTFKLNKKIDLAASWMYATGNRITLPVEEYQSLDSANASENVFYWYTYVSVTNVSQRNNYKMSDSHHLDLEMKYYRTPRKIWTFSIYNVYNHFNPYTAKAGSTYDSQYKNVVIESSLLRLVPSVSFTYKLK